jgi:hypothetical protein
MPGHNDTSNNQLAYRVEYRDIRHPRLEFKTGTLVVIAPKSSHCGPSEIVDKHRRWVEDRRRVIEAAIKDMERKSLDTRRSEEEFRDLVHGMVRQFASRVSRDVTAVYFRKLNSKWASCSTKGGLTFNRYLRFLPQHLIEYVVYHELLHMDNRKHDTRFWRTLHKEYANSNQRERELLAYWFLLQKVLGEKSIRL